MIKMVVCDMDGTLLNSDLQISKENLDAINALREKGIRFCIATGRPEQLVKEYIGPLQMEDPMILYNGSVIGHPFKKNRLYEMTLKKDDIQSIIEYCEENEITYMLYTQDRIISKPNYRVDFFEERNKLLSKKNQCVFEDIQDIEEILKYNISKILLIESNQEKYEKTKTMVSQYSQLEIVASQKGFIDINPEGASKGNALQILANHFGYTLDEVVVFGDQDNDASMLEIAGIGIAMEGASTNAKNAASDQTISNNDSGVAYWINKNIL